MRRLLVVLAAALATVAPSGLGARRPPVTTASLSMAYEQWIVRRYPGPAGHWVCPVGDRWSKTRGGVYCEAEFFGPTRWHFLYTLARMNGSRIRFVPLRRESASWTRRWRSVPRHRLGGNGAPGSGAVNAPLRVHDWSWLAMFAHDQWRAGIKRRTFVASDGPIAYEFRIFERFTCVLGREVVTCTTPFGDALRYRPVA
jgi:hypothetical protein